MAAVEEEVVRYQAERDAHERGRAAREEEVEAERNLLIDRIRTQARADADGLKMTRMT